MKRNVKKTIKILGDITKVMFSELLYFASINLRYAASVVNVIVPYAMYYIGQDVAMTRGYIAVGGEIFIPIMFAILVYYMHQIANRCGKGSAIPVPENRFTEVDDETGEVTILTSRTEEMLLYMADLENWLERRNML